MKLTPIIPSLLYQRGRTDRVPYEEKRATLIRVRVGAVIGLWHPDPDLILGPWRYVSHPIPDGRVMDGLALELIAEAAAQDIREGRAVLSTCHAGRNRSGFMNALIVRALLGVDGRTALERVRSVRPGAVDNPAFEEYLMDMDRP